MASEGVSKSLLSQRLNTVTALQCGDLSCGETCPVGKTCLVGRNVLWGDLSYWGRHVLRGETWIVLSHASGLTNCKPSTTCFLPTWFLYHAQHLWTDQLITMGVFRGGSRFNPLLKWIGFYSKSLNMHEDAPKINGNVLKCKPHKLFSVPVDYHMIMISHSNL